MGISLTFDTWFSNFQLYSIDSTKSIPSDCWSPNHWISPSVNPRILTHSSKVLLIPIRVISRRNSYYPINNNFTQNFTKFSLSHENSHDTNIQNLFIFQPKLEIIFKKSSQIDQVDISRLISRTQFQKRFWFEYRRHSRMTHNSGFFYLWTFIAK